MEKLLADLRFEYFRMLPEKLDTINDQIQRLRKNPEDREALQQIHIVVHKIHGTSGSFGFDQIARLCGNWSAVLEDHLGNLTADIGHGRLDVMDEYMSSLRNLVEAESQSMHATRDT